MNRTIEQWQKVAETRFHGRVLDQAMEDMQELARQLDELQSQLDTERAAWSAEKTKLLCSNDGELSDALLAELEK